MNPLKAGESAEFRHTSANISWIPAKGLLQLARCVILSLMRAVTLIPFLCFLATSAWPGDSFVVVQSGGAGSAPQANLSQRASYRIEGDADRRDSVVRTFTLGLSPLQEQGETKGQWVLLDATKVNGQRFRVWLLVVGYPPPTLVEARGRILRYILQEGEAEPREFRDRLTGKAVLPALGGWLHLFPRPDVPAGEAQPTFPPEADYLGHRYRRESLEEGVLIPLPVNPRVIELLPEVLVGLASNTRQKDEARRYDDSDYELVRLTRADYQEMVAAGINCLHVDAEQLRWAEDLSAFYWSVDPKDLPYPECLYRSPYLGPVLFLDEPAVGTRDYAIRPKLAKDKEFRKTLTPQVALEAFQQHFEHVLRDGAPTALLQGLAGRADVDLGTMRLRQENLFSWETMVSTAAYQLSQDLLVPAAMVFEPPGRVGTFRTLPELDMTYGCQLPVDDPKCLADLIYGFLRGAARLTGKSWGTSIYGAVDRTDAFWLLTHAYDLGATRFFFWDNARSACVPYHECLALARNLQAHVANYPQRDLPRLGQAAETAILLPPGYNLGHVALGKGSLWGLGELNLERLNRHGIKYRVVMSNFFAEIENCFRQGVAFDLLWNLPQMKLTGYREIVRIREDGKVELLQDGRPTVLDRARIPLRPPGLPPQLAVNLSAAQGKAPLRITAQASVIERSAPVYYTFGADSQGVYHNAAVAWELYGPGDEDYRFLQPPGLRPTVRRTLNGYEATTTFTLNRPGRYRLRAATVDLAGRTAVVWTSIVGDE